MQEDDFYLHHLCGMGSGLFQAAAACFKGRENDFGRNISLHSNFRACILTCPYFEMYLVQEDAAKMSYITVSFWMKVFLAEQLYICLH